MTVAALVWAMLAAAAQAASPLGEDDARHLLSRTGFSAQPREVAELARLSRREAVDRLLMATRTRAQTPPPAWALEPYEPPVRLATLSDEERMMQRRQLAEQGRDLRAWWVAEMLVTPSPLTERMVLFWHNHFTSSLRKVRMPLLMYRQHETLRRHALGNFADMLHAMARDPAMMVYLDGVGNRKGQPNENFAREVMELFTLGEGRYTERDIKEAARAFTGWSVSRASGEFVVRPQFHDDGPKTVLGVTGHHDGGAVLDILLARPETAQWVVGKLWREFVSPQPDQAEVRRIAARFKSSRYDIRAVLRELLISDAFYAPVNRATLIKSPVDLVVGTLRQFQLPADDALPYAQTIATLGQVLFAPPNVKGWPGGEAWIDSTTLLVRKRFLENMFRQADGMAHGQPQPMLQMSAMSADDLRGRAQRALAALHWDGAAWLSQYRDAASWQRTLLPRAPIAAIAGSDVSALRQAVFDPVYQLK